MEMMDNKKRQSGFTLIEVAIAIAILGVALMTLTALTTRLMNDTRDEVNRIQASFLGQYILGVKLADRFSSQNNSGNSDAGNANASGNLYQKLQDLDFFTGLDSAESFSYLKSWTYNLKVEPLSLPLTQNQFEKYSIELIWGKGGEANFKMETIKKAKDLGQNIQDPNGQNGTGIGGGQGAGGGLGAGGSSSDPEEL